MRTFITFLAVIALANASVYYSLNAHPSSPLQYGINYGSVTRQEIRTPDGIVHGTYSYIGSDGKSQSISYGNNNEKGAQEAPAALVGESNQESQEMTEEIVESSTENQMKGNEATTEGDAPSATLPEPVPYTPEVAAARAAHFAARDQAIYLQQVASSQQQMLNQRIIEYPPFFRDYYGAAKHFRSYYFL